MKKFHCAFFILFTFLITSCGQKDTLTNEEVMAVIRKFDKGWLEKDTVIVNEVLAPGYIYFTQSGGIFSRNNLLYTANSPEYKLKEMVRDQYLIKIHGNTAVVSTAWKGVGTYRGAAFDDYQRCSITIIKDEGKVRILSEHCTPLKRKQTE